MIDTSYIKQGFKNRKKRYIIAMTMLIIVSLFLAILCLLLGNTNYSLSTVIKVLSGENIKGATYAIKTIRLPRMLAGILAGLSFGAGGYIFQTMLRNPLASPDIIGITSGSSAAAVICILVFHISGPVASIISVIGGLVVTLIIYYLSARNGFSNSKMILIGIGIGAMLRAVISYVLLKASEYDVPGALHWLTGSLNGIELSSIPLMAVVIVAILIVVLILERNLKIISLGDQSAISLGVNVNKVRGILSVAVVLMLAFAIAVTGPIASVAFLAGPIAQKVVGKSHCNALSAGLIGVVLILASDLIGQHALGTRFPVGTVTGILGVPYLLYLLVAMGKNGGGN